MLEAWLRILKRSETVDDVISGTVALLTPQQQVYVRYAWYGCIAVVVLYVARGIWIAFFSTPSVVPLSTQKSSQSTSKKKPSAASGSGNHRSATPPPLPAPSEAPVTTSAAQVASKLPLPPRSRPYSAAAAPTSTIKGFPHVGVLATSPCQRYLLITCRKTGKVRWYPQSTKRAFMSKGPELKDHYFTALEGQMFLPTDKIQRVDASAVAFNGDGSVFALGDAEADRWCVFAFDGKSKQVTLSHMVKMPHLRLMSTLNSSAFGRSMSLSDDGSALFAGYGPNAEVEMLTLPLVPSAVTGKVSQAVSSKAHFSIGHATAWSLSGATAVVAGSFIKEARLATLHPKSDGTSVAIKSVATMPHAACAGQRVISVGFVRRNVPEFLQSEFMVVFMQDGRGMVFDVSQPTDSEPVLKATFSDTDMAARSVAADVTVGMSIAVCGAAFKEHIRIALWQQYGGDGDISVHDGQPHLTTSRTAAPVAMTHVKDLHDAHDGQPLQHVRFVQNGEGLATAGVRDELHVRLWELPPVVVSQ